MMYNQKYHQFKTFYNHKLGFHINGPRQDAFEEVLRLRPRIVKTLDFSVDIMKQIRKEIPDVFLIGRLAVYPQDFGQLDSSALAMGSRIKLAQKKGRKMAERILKEEVNKDSHHINGKPIFNAWESLNEIFPEAVEVDLQKLYDEYQVAFGEKILAAGFEPIGMNFATGNFRGDQFVDNFAGTLETYKYLGFHEYDWPYMDRLHNIGLSEPENEKSLRERVPYVGSNEGNDGMWLCLRYRRILYGGVRQKYGDKHIAVITECGMTQGVQQGNDVGPWAKENTLPRDYPDASVKTPINGDNYWQTLMWYNNEIMKDDYVLGACLFVTGAAGLAEWETFEHLGPVLNRLHDFQETVDNAYDPAKPAPLTAPEGASTSEVTSKPLNVVTLTPTSSESSTENPISIASTTETRSTTVTAITTTSNTEVTPKEPASATTTPEKTSTTESDATVEKTVTSVAVTTTTTEVTTNTVTTTATRWTYTLTTGTGLPLLVGDISLANEPITITQPNGQQAQLVSGSKPEYGAGGFESYANQTGTYLVQFLDHKFELPLTGQFTKVIFQQVANPESVAVDLALRDAKETYAVNEKIFFKLSIKNLSTEPISFGVLGLLTDTGRFQTSWDNGTITAGKTFTHEDGLTFDTAGHYQVQLSICFSTKDACLSPEGAWTRFEPKIDVVIE